MRRGRNEGRAKRRTLREERRGSAEKGKEGECEGRNKEFRWRDLERK